MGRSKGRVVHFEIHAQDPQRAIDFYAALLDWTFHAWEGPSEYWLVDTGSAEQPGINGGLVRRRGDAPVEGQAVNAFVCTVDVEDLDAILAHAEQLGAPLAVPKMAVPGIGWLAYVKDPEGNILGLMQEDAGAA